MNDQAANLCTAPTSDFRDVSGRTFIIAFFLGTAIVALSIFFGRSYAFDVSFLAFSYLMTLLWRKAPRPWIFLVSILAATPIAISRYNFSCNLIFALWFALFNTRYLFRLPKWIYLPSCLAVIGITISSMNWMSGDAVLGIMRQGVFAYNLFLGPFLLLPVVYLRMRESRDHAANLKGLLLCLIVPSTVILISAKLFGTVGNWVASQHFIALREGYLQYKLGNVVVNFLRTEVGIILAVLICASTAVIVSQVKGLYRLLAGACLVSNVFLLLATGSFGSGLACICGLSAIFFTQFRTVSVTKALASVLVICCVLFLSYSFSPPSMKKYLGKRYEYRVVDANTDRFGLWARAVEQIIQHPEGVGLTELVGDKVKTYIHNEYLVYTVSYGLIGGLGYASLVVGLLVFFNKVRRRTIRDPSALAIHLAGLGVIVVVAVNSMTDHMNANPWYFNVIWSVIWYSYFCSRAMQAEQAEQRPAIPTGNDVNVINV